MEGDIAFLVIDSRQRKLGYDKGVFVNEIPEARFTRIKGPSLADQDVPPVYYMPLGFDDGGDGTIDETVNMADQK